MKDIFLGSDTTEMGVRTGQFVQDIPCIQADRQVLLSQVHATETLKNKNLSSEYF